MPHPSPEVSSPRSPGTDCSHPEPRPEPSPESRLNPRPASRPESLAQWIDRHRYYGYGLVAVLLGLGFNGQWRVSTDSALYRVLARHLLAGEGYTYLGVPHTHAYPGLPWLLAGLQRLLGASVFPMLVLNLLLVTASLVMIYRMVRATHARWIAVSVLVICGVSRQLHELTAGVLTDVPFFFATCLTLWCYQNLRRAGSAWRGLGWGAGVVAGVGLAATLRPAFWILLAALVLTIAWEAVRGSRRLAVGLGIGLVLCGAAWVGIDPRTGGEHAGLLGADELRLVKVLEHPGRIWTRASTNAPALLTEHGVEAFFGTNIGPGVDLLLTIIVFAGAIALGRRRPLWGLLAVATLGVTVLFAGTVPRYYVMILPVLALGWVQTLRLAGRGRRRRRGWVIVVGLVLAIAPNVVLCGRLIRQQRAPAFARANDDGMWMRYRAMARAIRDHVPAGDRVIGPRGSLLTLLSERDVAQPGDYDDAIDRGDWPGVLRDKRYRYAILPGTVYKHQGDNLRTLLGPVSKAVRDQSHDGRRWLLVRLRVSESEPYLTVDRVIASGPIAGER